MLAISHLYIYPVKSLGGIEVQSAEVHDRGLQYDRRWMITDLRNHCMTQRDVANMALFSTSIEGDQIVITHKNSPSEKLVLPASIQDGNPVSVTIWNDRCQALEAPPEFNQWISAHLGILCKLVYMPRTEHRRVNPKYAIGEEITSFSDAYPILTIGQASLDELNSRLEKPLPMNRFRPNIVFTGGHPFEEDEMAEFDIGNIRFYGVKLCDRCVVTTINQETTEKGKEPLKTLSGYRLKDNNVYFGQNLLHRGSGSIRVGDPITIIRKKAPEFPLK